MKPSNYECLILGTGNAVIHPERKGPGFLLNWEGRYLLFDIGYGTMSELLSHQLSYKDLDALFLSHWHIDHISDLLPTLFVANIPTFHRERPLPVFAPVGFKKVFSQLCNIFGQWINGTFRLRIIECHPDIQMQWNNIDISCYKMAHSASALGYRLQSNEKVFAYSGDTEKISLLKDLFQGVDLGIIECSFPDNMGLPGHLNVTDVIELLQDISYKKMALCHLYTPARLENIRQNFNKAGLKNIVIPTKGEIISF